MSHNNSAHLLLLKDPPWHHPNARQPELAFPTQGDLRTESGISSCLWDLTTSKALMGPAGTWLSGHSTDESTVGLDDLSDLFQS